MDFKTKYYKLSNGVRVLEVPMDGVESVVSLALVRTGSRNEKPKQAGISHVLEHMVFKGTDKYPTFREVAMAVDSMGANVNAFTAKEYTGYYIKSAATHLNSAMDVLSEILLRPKLRQEDLDREKGVIIEEIKMYEDLPMERASEEFENLLYGGSDLGRLIIGSEKTVKAMTAERLRAYMSDWYRGSNVLVVVAGKVDGAREVVSRVFGEMGNGEMQSYVSKGKFGSERKFHLKKDTEQAHFVMGFPGMAMDDERRYALILLQIILGGNMSSRLFAEIREKRGLAYYVKSGMDLYSDVGNLLVRAGVKLDKLGEAVKVVREQVYGFAGSVSEEELAKAKDYYKGKFVLNLEDSMAVAQFYGDKALILDKIVNPKKLLERIEGVGLADLQRLAGEIFSEGEERVVVVGPEMV